MKRKFYKISITFIVLFSLLSCYQPIDDMNNIKNESNLKLTSVLKEVINDFSIDLKEYENKDSINLLVFVRIVNANSNEIFKVHIEGIDYKVLNTDSLNIDSYFIKNRICYVFDLGISSIIKTNNNGLKDEIINVSKIKNYRPADTRFPSWLIQFEKNKMTKMNKNANSMFYPSSDKIGVFTENGTELYSKNEWGEILDSKGEVIGILNEKNKINWYD